MLAILTQDWVLLKMTKCIIDDLDDMIEHVIDDVFSSQTFTFSMYNYVRANKLTGPNIDEFINSSTAHEITQLVTELDLYLEGGDDSTHRQVREGYGHLGKPTARKIAEAVNKLYGPPKGNVWPGIALKEENEGLDFSNEFVTKVSVNEL